MAKRLTDMLRQIIHPAQVRGEELITIPLDWFEQLIDCIHQLELNFERDEDMTTKLSEMRVFYERDGPAPEGETDEREPD